MIGTLNNFRDPFVEFNRLQEVFGNVSNRVLTAAFVNCRVVLT